MRSTVHDITERKKAEEMLCRSHNELEQQVRERTADLAQTVETLRNEIKRRSVAEQALVDRSEKLRALASELTLTEQRERKRLTQILHDGLQQVLVGAKFRISVIKQTDDKVVNKAAIDIENLINESIDISRSLTSELSPPILQEGELVSALEWLTRWMLSKHGLTVSIVTQDDTGSLDEDLTILFFQAARELLFKIVKHAGTKNVGMEYSRIRERVQLFIIDHGTGFDPAQLRTAGGLTKGFGLFSIRERIGFLGGTLDIESSPGKGSRITLTVPLSL